MIWGWVSACGFRVQGLEFEVYCLSAWRKSRAMWHTQTIIVPITEGILGGAGCPPSTKVCLVLLSRIWISLGCLCCCVISWFESLRVKRVLAFHCLGFQGLLRTLQI